MLIIIHHTLIYIVALLYSTLFYRTLALALALYWCILFNCDKALIDDIRDKIAMWKFYLSLIYALISLAQMRARARRQFIARDQNNYMQLFRAKRISASRYTVLWYILAFFSLILFAFLSSRGHNSLLFLHRH